MIEDRLRRLTLSQIVGCGLVILLAGILAAGHINGQHGWGDDFAGYLLQARSLVAGNPAVEVELNGRLQRASDWRVGPDAYPWGLPALIALAVSIGGWSMTGLKLIGFVSLLLCAPGTFILARQVGLGWRGATVGAAFVALQPSLIGAVANLGSDLPFLALSLAGLILAARLIPSAPLPEREAPGPPRVRLILTVALVSAFGFAMRSNGAVMMVTVGFMLCVVLLRSTAGQRSRTGSELLCFALSAALCVLAYFLLLPDGSLVHVSYLSLEPISMLQRVRSQINALGHVLPNVVLPGPLEPFGVLALLLCSLVGAVALRRQGLLLLAYLGGHMLLLTVFKFEGGMRYYFPLLPALAILAIAGVGSIFEAASRHRPRLHARRNQIAGMATALTVAWLAIMTTYMTLRSHGNSEDGPFSAATTALVEEIAERVPPSARISFFKPRVLRWRTGREVVLVREPASAATVDVIVLHPQVGDEFQLSRAQVEALGDFDLSYDSEQFLLYVRKPDHPRKARS